ncbi:Ground-like domain-containing protein [Aphelenchoides besseyi]|nr:Ground-like domain-containing protein [Aphelenchoides besseyi]
MLRVFALVCVLMPMAEAFLFGGGSSCGCAPPPPCPPPPPPCLPQPCLPQLPPIQIPSLCLPPLPRLQLPCPPPSCGCGCGRKKRSTPVVSRHHEDADANLCNNPQIRKIILQNITEDPVNSKIAIHSELKAKMPNNYVVLCASNAFSFVADTNSFCVEGTETNTCYVFEA